MPILIDRVIAPYFATNCWILSEGVGQEALIVDPGIAQPNLVKAIRDKLTEHHLKAVAILITHGHLDHFYSVLPLQADSGINNVLIHESDRDLLSNPEHALGDQGRSLLKELSNKFNLSSNFEPEGIQALRGGSNLTLAGMKVDIAHAPGHTPGSILATVEDSYLISGDTLFAGSIGRTDLPRGSTSDMAITLREKIATLPDHLQVLPGHGDRTNIGTELRSNPYLRAAIEGRL